LFCFRRQDAERTLAPLRPPCTRISSVKELAPAKSRCECRIGGWRHGAALGCEPDYLDTVSLLIQADASVKAKDRDGFTPLYFACTNGSAAVIPKLLDARADPSATDESGETALMTATRSGSIDAVKVRPRRGLTARVAGAGFSRVRLRAA
jgi:hypothetical protein